MAFVVIVLLVSTFVAMLRGGRLSNLPDIRLSGWWLLILGFGMQASTTWLPGSASRGLGLGLVLASFFPLLLMVILNRDKPGMWLSGVGILMNLSVITANQGMPVLLEAATVASGFSESVTGINDFKHVILDDTSSLTLFADVIPLRIPLGPFSVGSVISLGDVLLAVGLGVFLEAELRRPVRWFKRGAQGKAGSARHPG